jgi:outer membrane receptor protein involved in Fe transport
VFIGSRVDSDFNFPTISSNAGYAAWHANGEVHLSMRTTVFATIENLTDREYMEPLGYRGLGRAVRVGLRARF